MFLLQVQCNVFEGASGEVALTAAGGVRQLPGPSENFENAALVLSVTLRHCLLSASFHSLKYLWNMFGNGGISVQPTICSFNKLESCFCNMLTQTCMTSDGAGWSPLQWDFL